MSTPVLDKSLLDLYADYLLSSFGPTTATGLSRLLDGGISHDKITRFLTERDFTSASLWRVVKPLVRQVQSEGAVLVVDDSIAHKPHTDASELIGWHYDHTTGTSVKGINFLTALYCTGEVSLPVAFTLVEKDEEFTDEKTGQAKRRATVSKNEHYRSMLRACVKNGMPFRYVLNDVWYAAADNMKLVKGELGKDFVMPLKSNRKVALSGQGKKDGRYHAVDTLTLEHGRAREVWLEQVPFPLLLVKQVFTNKDGGQGLLYLVTSDTTLDGGQIMGLYQERWQIEEYHKSLKQNASLACSPTRTKRTQSNHFFLSLCAFVKLESLKIKTLCGHFALKSKLYMAALRAAFDQLQRLQPSNLLGSTSA